MVGVEQKYSNRALGKKGEARMTASRCWARGVGQEKLDKNNNLWQALSKKGTNDSVTQVKRRARNVPSQSHMTG